MRQLRPRRHAYFWLAMCTLLLASPSSPPPVSAAVMGQYDVALLRVRFTDTSDALYTVAELTAAGGELHDYFDQLSFGKLNLRVTVADVSVPHSWNEYLACTGASCPSLIADAAERAAAGGLSFAGVEGILIVRAGCRTNDGWTNGPATISRPGVSGTFQQSYDVECGRSTLPSTVNWGGWAHELGHQLEGQEGRWSLTHPTGYESGYNLMDSCYPCGESAFSLADASLTNESGAIAGGLVFPGWLPASRIRVIPGTTGGETVVLSPVTEPLETTTAMLGIKIPIATGQYYFLEARRRLRADSWPSIYDEGIQIIRINEFATDRLGDTIDSCDTLVPGGCIRTADPRCSAPTPATQPGCWPFPLWHTRNTFRDGTNNIAISIGPQVGNGWAVTVTRGVPAGAPDLYVTPWLTPPMNSWETVDIWVDSSCNGYEDAGGALRYGRRADGTVIGNGDDPCANHPNRVYARVRNIGDSPALSASLVFEVSNPLGVGISGTWQMLGTATPAAFPALASIPAGGEATVFVEWMPNISLTDVEIQDSHFAFHSCLRVRAAGVPGEFVTSNLDGEGEQENVSSFEVGAGRSSGNRSTERSFRLLNPKEDKQGAQRRTYFFMVNADLPAGWTYEIAGGAQSITLEPGESRVVPVKIASTGALTPGSSWHVKVSAYWMERLVPPAYVRTSRIEYRPRVAGGVNFSAQAVEEATMSLAATMRDRVVTVTGRLDPAVPKTQVTIDYVPSRGSVISHVVTTDENGAFRDAGVQVGNGTLTVRGFWQGSSTLSSAVSGAVVVGRPWWLWWALAIAILLLVIAMLLMVKRRRT